MTPGKALAQDKALRRLAGNGVKTVRLEAKHFLAQGKALWRLAGNGMKPVLLKAKSFWLKAKHCG